MNNGPPYYYDYINWARSQIQPSTVHVTNTGLSQFFQRYLLQKAISVFEWEMPESWESNYVLYVLYCWGYVGVFKTDTFGVIPQQCGLRGYNVQYQPTNIIVSNPLISGMVEPKIGTQCEILRLQPDYGGIWDLISFYADQMALVAESFGVNTLNSKLPYIFMARDQSTAQSFKKMYDQFASGQPCVVVDKKLFNTGETGEPNIQIQPIDAAPAKNISELLTAWKQIEIMFESLVGIPNVSSTKRERELTTELQANTLNTRTLASGWLQELQKSCRKINAMFGIGLSVDWRWKEMEGNNYAGDNGYYSPVQL